MAWWCWPVIAVAAFIYVAGFWYLYDCYNWSNVAVLFCFFWPLIVIPVFVVSFLIVLGVELAHHFHWQRRAKAAEAAQANQEGPFSEHG